MPALEVPDDARPVRVDRRTVREQLRLAASLTAQARPRLPEQQVSDDEAGEHEHRATDQSDRGRYQRIWKAINNT